LKAKRDEGQKSKTKLSILIFSTGIKLKTGLLFFLEGVAFGFAVQQIKNSIFAFSQEFVLSFSALSASSAVKAG